MTKAELIKRHGLEWYEQYKARVKNYQRERYQNDSEFREYRKAQVYARSKERYHNDSEYRKYENTRTKTRSKARYVEDGRIDLIENYELAKADDFKDWDIHHRLEIHDDYINSKKHLQLMNLYYNRPTSELIWLRSSEHSRIHYKARNREDPE